MSGNESLFEEAGGEVLRTVVVLADMLFASKVRGAGDSLGVPVLAVGRPEGLSEAVLRSGARLVLVDLELRSGDSAAAVRALRSDPALTGVRVVAFASHSNAAAIEAGRAAGADRVLARSAFVASLPELLAGSGAGER